MKSLKNHPIVLKKTGVNEDTEKNFRNYGYGSRRSYMFSNDSVEVTAHGKYNCEKDGVLTTVVIKKNNERFQGHIFRKIG